LDDTTRDRAIRAEALLPRVLRTMFRPDPHDPLVELPVGQMRMMRLLANKAWTPSNLGEELGLSVSAVTQMANRLESIGYVDRTEDPSDRRVKHLTLTTVGRELMSVRREQRVHRLESVLSRMSTSRQVEFTVMLEELLEAGEMANEVIDNSIFMEAEVEQKLPPPPAYVMEEK
jgi:DNA-binding MarR family transcriptional regulator